MNKKILSIILALSLCLTLLPATVLAADPVPSTGLSFSSTLPTTETVYTAGSGTITYKPASGNDSARLILDNADINAADGAAISLGNNEFVIELHGRNTLIGKIGIYSNTNITITNKDNTGAADEDAQLTVYANGEDNAKDAIYSRGAITIDGGSYYITSRNGSTISATESTTIKNADARLVGDGGATTLYGQLTVENTTLSVTANGDATLISGGSLILNSGADVTANSAAEINFAADKFLTVNSGASFTLAPCTVMTFNNDGVLNNSGTFVNNGTLIFDGSSVLTAEELTQKGITGTGFVLLNGTRYTNSGATVKTTDADLDLDILPDSNDFDLNGFTLATDNTTGAKTLTLGNVKLGTVSLPDDASVTITVADGYSAYADKITSSGISPLTLSGSGTLAVLKGVTLSGNLTVDGPSVTAIGPENVRDGFGIIMNNGGDILVSSGTLTAAGSALQMGDSAAFSGGVKLHDSGSDLTVSGSNSKMIAIGNIAKITSNTAWLACSQGIYLDEDVNNCTVNVENGGTLVTIGSTVWAHGKAFSGGICSVWNGNGTVNVDGDGSTLTALGGNVVSVSTFESAGILFCTGGGSVNVKNAGELNAAGAVCATNRDNDNRSLPGSYGIKVENAINVSGTGSLLNAFGGVAISHNNTYEETYTTSAGVCTKASVNVSGNNSVFTSIGGTAIGKDSNAESVGILFLGGGSVVLGSDNVTSGTLIAKGRTATTTSGANGSCALSQGILFQRDRSSSEAVAIVNGNLIAEGGAAATTSNNAFAKSYGIGFNSDYKSTTLTVNGGCVSAKSSDVAGATTSSAALYFTGGAADRTTPALTLNNGLRIAKPSNGVIAKDGDYWTVKSGDAVSRDVFISRMFTVSLNTNGGTINEGNVTNYAQGLGATLPTADDMTYTGYAFEGWYDNSSLTGNPVTEIATTETGDKNFHAKWRDITDPTGEIKLGGNTWTDLINAGNVTFDLFFKNKKQVEITAFDNSGDAVVIGYLLSGQKLTETELESKTFTTYSGAFDIEPNNELIIYAKLTDQTGNSSYISSNGIVLDDTKPTVTGIEDGKTYCTEQSFTVSDAHDFTVTVNGEPVTLTGNSSYTLSPAADPYTVIATDEAGNVSEITVTVNDGHRGGYPTCVSGEKCENCGEEYGVLDSDRHNIEKVSAVAATVTATGNTEYWKCKDCGKIFSDEYGENEINISDTVIPKLPPEIIEGNGQSVSLGENRSLTFRSNAAYSDFIRVEVDGKTVDEKNYTKKEGSTLVTLKAEYVESLPVGEHTLGIVSESGTATTVFTVNPKADTGKGLLNTGDSSNTVLLCAITLISGGTVAVVCSYGKKSKRYRVK